MKIYLFSQEKIISFLLPNMVSGEFLFDEHDEAESKLINISAKDNNWYLMSTSTTSVLLNNQRVDGVCLEVNHFYALMRDNIQYIIYIIDVKNETTALYSLETYSNSSISCNESSNIKLSLPFKNVGSVNLNYVEKITTKL